jgi:hypothetical protein
VLTGHAVDRMLAGEPWETIAPELRAHAERAFDLLESGLGDYGRRPLGQTLGDGDHDDEEDDEREADH